MRRFFGSMGSVSRVLVESQALKRNMIGDPTERVVDLYVPAGHDGQGLPLLVDLVGFTGSGLSHTNWVGFRENSPFCRPAQAQAPFHRRRHGVDARVEKYLGSGMIRGIGDKSRKAAGARRDSRDHRRTCPN